MTTIEVSSPATPFRAIELDPVTFFDPRPAVTPAAVEIVIPVYNEEVDLARNVERLTSYLHREFPLTWTVTIADNASTDRTWEIATRLALQLDGVRAAHLDAKGRGRALRSVWLRSSSPVVAYMDVDLSTDLRALLPLVAPLVSDHSDVAIGSRLAPSSRVARGPKREAISRSYNLILKATLHAGFSDAQCGFKAVRRDAAQQLLPQVVDNGWFFDTELLVLAERAGMRIHEVPVDWCDDPDSRVHVASTAKADLQGVWRMLRSSSVRAARLDARREASLEAALAGVPGRRPIVEQLVRFASIGVMSTVAFSLLFLALRGPLGDVSADAVAFAACVLANVTANRRFTFSLHGRRGPFGDRRGIWRASAAPIVLNLAALALAGALGIASAIALVALLTAANAAGTVLKVLLLNRLADGAPALGR